MTNTLTSNNRTPRYVNAISPPYPFQVVDEDENIQPLTGASTSRWMLWLQDLNNPATIIEGTGTFSLIDAANGKAQYQWSVADLQTPGIYYLSISIKLLNEAGYRQLTPQIIVIAQLPGAQFMATQDVNVLQVLGSPISSNNPVPTSGPVTIASGADVTAGTPADAAYTGSGNATFIAGLKGIFAVLAKVAPQTVLSFSGTPPTQTSTSAAVALTPTATSYQTTIQNNTTEDIHVAFNGVTATAGSLTIKNGGNALIWTLPVTGISIAPTNSAQNINGSSANNIVVMVTGL